MTNKKDIAHFERLGRAIAKSRIPDPTPRDHLEVLARMEALDPNCGMGTEDPLGGDLPSHLAYLANRDAWVRKRRQHDRT